MPSKCEDTSPVSDEIEELVKSVSGPSTAAAAGKSESGIAKFPIRSHCSSGIPESTTRTCCDRGSTPSLSSLMFNIDELGTDSPSV